MPVIPSVGIPFSTLPYNNLCPSGSCSERFSKYTPENMIKKPQRREIVLTLSVVLNPWKSMKEAVRTAVVNVT